MNSQDDKKIIKSLDKGSFLIGLIVGLLIIGVGLFFTFMTAVAAESLNVFWAGLLITVMMWGGAIVSTVKSGDIRATSGIVVGLLIVVIAIVAFVAWLFQQPIGGF